MSEATETLERLEEIVRHGLTTRVGLLGFEDRCKHMAQLLYDAGARLHPYPVETDEADAAELDEVALHVSDRAEAVAVIEVPVAPAELERVHDMLMQAAAGLPAPVREEPGFPAYDLHVWREGDPEPSGRPAVVCADGVTALWDAEHGGWSRQRIVHHPVPEGAPKGTQGGVTVGPLGMDWPELLADHGPVREATEHEARLVVEQWPGAEDRAS